MPTGYTYPVADGEITTLRDFALLCARAFGATISMRDEPLDAAIPEQFEPNTKYCDERLARANSLLAEIPQLSDDECAERAAAEYKAALGSHRKSGIERQLRNIRIESMLAAVREWETEAEGIKSFMIEQLRMSLDTYESEKPVRLTGPEWRAAKLDAALRNQQSATKHRDEEIARTADRNRWLAALRSSLPAPTPTPTPTIARAEDSHV